MQTAKWNSKHNNQEEIFSFDVNIKEDDIIQDKLWERNKSNLEKYQNNLIFYLMGIDKGFGTNADMDYCRYITGDKDKVIEAITKLLKLYSLSNPKYNSQEHYEKLRKSQKEGWNILPDLVHLFTRPEVHIDKNYKDDMKINESQLELLEALLVYSISSNIEKERYFRKINLNLNITEAMIKEIKNLDIRLVSAIQSEMPYVKDFNYTREQICEVLTQQKIYNIIKDKIYSLKDVADKDFIFEQLKLLNGKTLNYINPYKHCLTDKYNSIYLLPEYAIKITEIVRGSK